MKVFRGTLVHCRVPEKIEILPDHLIGLDEARQGQVRPGEGKRPARIRFLPGNMGKRSLSEVS